MQPNFINMKKSILLIASVLCLLFSACKDDSGDFVNQMFTDAELTSAARTCLSVAKDTAVAHLCDTGLMGEGTLHHIQLPDNATFRSIRDILIEQGQNQLLDQLEIQMNSACEQMGNGVTSTFNSTITDLTFEDPSSLVYGSNNALTTYLKLKYETTFQNSLLSSLEEKMVSTGAKETWRQILTTYMNAGGSVFGYDLNAYVMQNFTSAIFAEMEKEEALIRTDASHRVAKNLKNVFGEVGESGE